MTKGCKCKQRGVGYTNCSVLLGMKVNSLSIKRILKLLRTIGA